jgi:hypothetical protein
LTTRVKFFRFGQNQAIAVNISWTERMQQAVALGCSGVDDRPDFLRDSLSGDCQRSLAGFNRRRFGR